MCDPTAAVFALSTAQGLLEFQANDAHAKYQNKLAISDAANARRATLNDYRQIALREIQEEEAAGQKAEESARQARRAVSSQRVAAGEAGVSGLSLEALERGYASAHLRDQDVISRNLEMTRQQLNQERRSIHAKGASRTNKAASRMQTRPSPLGTAFQIGVNAANTFSTDKKK